MLVRTPAPRHTPPTGRTRSTSSGWSDGRELVRTRVIAQEDVTPLPGLGAGPPAVLVPNASDLTWARCRPRPGDGRGPAGRAGRVPDVQARAVLWVALLGKVHRAEVDPRTALEVFAKAWPRETSAAVLSRTALAMSSRVVPMFLPPTEQEAAMALVAGAADALLEHARSVDGAAGDALAVVAARVWAASGSDTGRLRRWAAGDGIPDGARR